MEAHEKNQNWCVITFALESNERSWIFLQEQLGFSPLGHSLGWQDYFQVFSHHLWEALIVFWEFILKPKKLVFLSILEWIMPKLLQGSKWTLVFFRLYCVSGRKVYAKDRAKFQRRPMERAKTGVLHPLASGSDERSLIFLQKQPWFSPLGHWLDWRECPKHFATPVGSFLRIYS